MKKLISILALLAAFFAICPSFAADDSPPPRTTIDAASPATDTSLTPAAASAADPAKPAAGPVKPVAPTLNKAEEPAKPAAPTPPTPNKGDTAWMIVATLLVILMTIPGLALFYGGLVRSKNMLSLLMQVFCIFALITVLWALYGYSVAFTAGNSFFGGFSKIFLLGITADSVAPTFSKGIVLPELIYIAFQGAFAAITVALIVGAFAERARFSAVLLFSVLWFTFCYLPVAHMVWYWDGPDGIVDAKTLKAIKNSAGFLWAKGCLDFAGGTVVHVNAGVAGLTIAYLIGNRLDYGKEAMAPNSLAFTMVGSSLLWVGWFGFNAGSNLEANGGAALAFVNTLLATAAAVTSWITAEGMIKGKASMLGAASGAVAGLVAVTPACGFISPMGAIAIGLAAGVVCLWGVSSLKRLLNADDALDVFGVHAVGGSLGSILTGVFASPTLGGQGIYDYVTNKTLAKYSIVDQVVTQLVSIGITAFWSALVAFIAYKVADMVLGFRVAEADEREGIDITSHGESAYNQ